MPAVNITASRTPADVAAAASLTRGVAYTVQNVSTVATLFVRDAAVQPDAAERHFRIEAGSTFTIRPTAGVGIWLWTDEETCPVILTEAT